MTKRSRQLGSLDRWANVFRQQRLRGSLGNFRSEELQSLAKAGEFCSVPSDNQLPNTVRRR